MTQQQNIPIQLAYAAGLFDGEGSVTISRKQTKRTTFRVSMASTDLGLVEFMHESFGGYLFKHIDTRRVKAQHQWVITGRKAVAFLQLIRPFMREANKIQRADFAISKLLPLMGDVTEGVKDEFNRLCDAMVQINPRMADSSAGRAFD